MRTFILESFMQVTPPPQGVRQRKGPPAASSAAPSPKPLQQQPKTYTSPSPPSAAPSSELQKRLHDLRARQQRLARAAPSYASAAGAYLKNFVKTHLGKDIDPEKTYLNAYVPPFRRVEAKGGPYLLPNPDAGLFVGSTPLWRVPVDNISNPLGTGFQPGDKRYRITDNDSAIRRYQDQRDTLDPTAFHASLTHLDFKAEYGRQIDAYYQRNADALRQVRRSAAQLDIDAQHAKGQLGDDDRTLAQRGLQGAAGARLVAQEDTDDEGPANVGDSQRKSDYRNTAVYPLDVGGYNAHDSLRIEDKPSGRTLLYMPGEEQPVQAFANRKEAASWLQQKSEDPAWTARFSSAHFSANDGGGRTDNLGVKNYLDGEADDRRTRANWRVGNDSGTRGDHYLESDRDIRENPFGALDEIARDGLRRDADFDITSNSDANKENLRKGLAAIPLPGSSVPGLFLAKKPSQFGDAALNTLGDLLWPKRPGGTPFKGRAPIMPLLRRKPVNIAPSRYEIPAPFRGEIARRVERAIAGDRRAWAPGPNGTWSADMASLQEARRRLVLDAQHAIDTQPLPKRPDAITWKPDNDSKDIVQRLYRQNKGVVFGEDHGSAASKQFLVQHMEELKKQGVRTLYMENLLTEFDQHQLDALADTGRMPSVLRHRLRQLDKAAGTRRGTQGTYERLVEESARHGIRVRAIDSVASRYHSPYTAEFRWPWSTRVGGMNHYASTVISADQRAGTAGKWAALVGEAHAGRFSNSAVSIPGLAERQGVPSVVVEDILEGLRQQIGLDPGRTVVLRGVPNAVKGDYLLRIPTLSRPKA